MGLIFSKDKSPVEMKQQASVCEIVVSLDLEIFVGVSVIVFELIVLIILWKFSANLRCK